MNQHSSLFFNRCFDKNKLKGLISWSLKNYGEAVTLELVEKLKNVGFSWATNAGISLSIDDLKIPKEKSFLLSSAEQIYDNTVKEFSSGNLTTVERLQQLIDTWHRTSELLKQEVVQNFRRSDSLNPVYMMAFSGARGNISQVRQLVGMRGLMADPQGQIIDFPIRSNFREGLTLTEYVISCYGARKGIVDTALRTATAGYLTRRLVDVAQHVVVASYDCETNEGIFLTPLKEFSKILLGLNERLIGRVLGEDLESIGTKNESISQSMAYKIHQKYEKVFVRSPLTCKARTGICQLCYGWSLAHGELVSIGEAVGIIAAQSIGEPGTQLTMRTFHTGGVFSGELIDQIESAVSGIVTFSNFYKGTLVRTSYGKIGFLTRQAGFFFINEKTKIDFPAQTILFVREGQKIEANQIVGEYASTSTHQDQGIQATQLVTAPKQGEIFFEDVLFDYDENDEDDFEYKAYQLGSFWILSSQLEPNSFNYLSTFSFSKGDLIQKNASYLAITVVKTTDFDLFVSLSKKTSKAPTLNIKYLTFCSEKLFYSKGIYIAVVEFFHLNKKVFNSHFYPLLNNFQTLSFSLINFSLADKKQKETFKPKQSSLLFSTGKNPFLISQNLLVLSIFKKRYKVKSFEIFRKFNSTFLFSGECKKSTILKVKKGNYPFQSRKTKNQEKVENSAFLKKFYSSSIALFGAKFQKIKNSWNFKILKFSYLNLFNFKEKIDAQFFVLSFSLTNTNCLSFKDNFFNLKKYYLSNTFLKFSENYFFSLFFKKENPLESNFYFLVNNEKKNVLASFSFSKKIVYFPFFGNTVFFNSGLSKTKIFNKQIVDATLFKSTELTFVFKEILVNQKLKGFFTFQSNKDLLWGISPYSAIQTISLVGSEKILLPKLARTEKEDIYQWRQISNKLINENFILGKIEKKLTEKTEILKVIKPKNIDQFLFLTKSDLTGLSIQSNFTKNQMELGALIRPGEQIGENFSFPFSGQILAIKKNKILIRKAFPILFSSKAIFHVFPGDFIEQGLPLMTLSYKRLTTGDIVQGIPRIEQLFEARQTTTALHDQLYELFETYRTRMKLEKAVRKSFQTIQRILIDNIQRVYQTQGVTISDKHLEVIVRQMTSTVRILDGGRTQLLRGELKSIDWIEKINAGIDIQKAEYEPVLLGITKASLETESFISAASFQETTKILSRAAIEGRTDYLRGLKENVILGDRIPAGTSAPLINYLTKFSSDVGVSSTSSFLS
uniref:DNA-directed RNA polymerase subunit beta'' n=1 Tax=Pedinomonas tuberculata TaxID=160064 RepID=A0A097KL82_9CHLO|nr:beta'' subunit of RNA polymerase [Pedinomonas tuberculata]AIT93931.1 beta'' subunit of RNA polymerase [Pedinomonas tuberculata]